MEESFDRVPRSEAEHVATDLRVLLGRIKRRLREQTQARGLTLSQLSVLARLNDEGAMTVTALARAEGIRSQSMGATVAVLEEAKLVQGAPDPRDRRQTILSLTDECREWIKGDRAAREDWLAGRIAATLSPDEQGQLAHALILLRRLVDP